MSSLAVFNHDKFEDVRIFEQNGNPYFVGKDICKFFGDKNPSRSLGRLDECDRLMFDLPDSRGLVRPTIVITESGLYTLLFNMQPQKANHEGVPDAYPLEVQERINKVQEFKHWVTSEVLPSIRKNGAYLTDEKAAAVVTGTGLIDLLEQAARQLKEKELVIQAKTQVIGELQPKADYYDKILQSKSLMTVTQIAKDYGMSGRAMNKVLSELKVQYCQSGQWLLYSKYQDKGYTSSQTVDAPKKNGVTGVYMYTKWTQKGRIFLYELLKSKKGLLPMIERN